MHTAIKAPVKAALRPFRPVIPYRINGRWFRIPLSGNYGYTNFTVMKQEPGVARTLRELLPRSGTFVDVGANVGQTLLLASSIDPHLNYLGIEPNFECCAALSRLIRLNGLNGDVLCGAASDQFSTANLHIPIVHSQNAALDPTVLGREIYKGTQRTALFTIDSLNLDISILKIDVEGYEAQVIKGASETIHRLHPPIIFEAMSHGETEELLTGFGYTITHIHKCDYLAV